MLGAQDDITVVGEAADGAEAVAAVLRERPDVVVMDIRMPGIDGIAATRRLAAADGSPRACWCSPPSTSTSTSTRRCAPAPAGSC